MESWNDLQDNAWTNNTSKTGVTSHYKQSVCVCVRRERTGMICVFEGEASVQSMTDF